MPLPIIFLTASEVGIWSYQFTPIGTALAAFVTQLYLGFRQVYVTPMQLKTELLREVGYGA